MPNKMISKFLTLKNIVSKHGGKLTVNKPDDDIEAYIEDILFDAFADATTLSTERLYSMAEKLFRTDKKRATLITDEFFKYCAQHLNESNNIGSLFINSRKTVSNVGATNVANDMHSIILKELQTNEQFLAAQSAVFDAIQSVTNRIASDHTAPNDDMNIRSITLYKPS